jgi:hypothetical protein
MRNIYLLKKTRSFNNIKKKKDFSLYPMKETILLLALKMVLKNIIFNFYIASSHQIFQKIYNSNTKYIRKF